MNNYQGEVRKRSQNLLIVEGNHEKNVLFWLIFKCFPEININMDEIWIYGTNIYQLYNDIVKQYGIRWAEENDDIDLPFVISKKQYPDKLRYKEDFTNIILVFDYERHDTNFSEQKILDMQKHFTDATDMGKLYINYPMIESYKHLCKFPDRDYGERKIRVSLQPGKEYKLLVDRETELGFQVDFPHKINDLLAAHYNVNNIEDRKKCCNDILNISDTTGMDDIIYSILQDVVDDSNVLTAKYQLTDWVNKQHYVHKKQTYWDYMRCVFCQIILHNICKANRIMSGLYQIPEDMYKECFDRLDLTEILKEQNLASKDNERGFIWVLNTCVFFIAEYNFNLVVDK